MKHVMIIALALLCCVGAFAETVPEDPLAAYALEQDAPTEIDLDGDGVPEGVRWTIAEVGEYEWNLVVTLTLSDGSSVDYPVQLEQGGVYLADLDSDGRTEILVTGDEASDDYITVCLKLTDGALAPCPFPNADRGDDNEGERDYGYGLLVGIDGDTVTLSGSQDVLGTWFARRTFRLAEGRFAFADGGEWVREVDLTSQGLWEYGALTLTRPLDYTAPDGAAATLPAGEKLVITASDKRTYARFVTRDGLEGTLAIRPDTERGWGMLVNGEGEDTWFEYVPYAD